MKGRRLTLSDVNGNGLRWRPFNGTWISGNEFVFLIQINGSFTFSISLCADGKLIYRDTSGGLSILEMETLTTEVLMTNSTFVKHLIFDSAQTILKNIFFFD